MTIKEVRVRTGRSISSIRADITRGNLKATKLENGRIEVSEEQLEEYNAYCADLSARTVAARTKRLEQCGAKMFKIFGKVGDATRAFTHATTKRNPYVDIEFTQYDNGKYITAFTVKSFERGGKLITEVRDSDGGIIHAKVTNGD